MGRPKGSKNKVKFPDFVAPIPKPKPDNLGSPTNPYNEGYVASGKGLTRMRNPYDSGYEHDEWLSGWQDKFYGE